MPVCRKCGHQISRHHRNVARRIFARASFRCNHCGANSNFYRPFVAAFQRWCQCPLCHNRQLTTLSKADKIDRRSRNPLRRLLGLFGFPLYHCTFCRYQFRDWRGMDPNRGELSPAATFSNDAIED